MTRVPGLIWFRVASAMFGLVCYSRAVAYSHVMGEPHESPGPMLVSDGGRYLWLFALLWAVIGTLLIGEAVRGRFSTGLVGMGAMMLVWASTYVAAWVMSHGHSPDLITAALYGFTGIGLVGVGVGLCVMVPAYRLMIRKQERHRAVLDAAASGPLDVVEERDSA